MKNASPALIGLLVMAFLFLLCKIGTAIVVLVGKSSFVVKVLHMASPRRFRRTSP